MEARKAKAIELAERGRVVRKGDGWLVFSLTSPNQYRVTLRPQASCTCEDYQLTHADCKHIIAARIALSYEINGTEPESVPETAPIQWPRKTYSQDWPNYTAAQVNEKDEFLPLLHDLCQPIQEPPPKRGRPPLALADTVYSACLKVYTTLSVRRFMSDLRAAHEKGYIKEVPHHNSVSRCLESPAVTPILQAMIAQSSLPLKSLEKEFAVDSSGFSACRFDRWFDVRSGRMKAEHSWVKAHAMVGTLTNVVVAAEVLGKDSGDAPQFAPLVRGAAEHFTIESVSGDSAYCSLQNHDAVAEVGGTPYLAFKGNATGGIGGLYEKMYHLFCYNKEGFLRRYHRRSNIESTFSAVKRLFGDSVRSKLDVAMRNEVLAKLVCFNITCLIHAAYELGVDVNFESKPASDPKILRFPGF